MASLSRKIPAEISPERREEIRTLAVKTFQTLGCNGVARIDFMIDTDTDALYVNEINTIPGSLAFYLWEAVGLPYSKMLVRLIDLALKRERERAKLTFSFDSNLLAHASLPKHNH
jgi:D-alanine-D-alanine ligase